MRERTKAPASQNPIRLDAFIDPKESLVWKAKTSQHRQKVRPEDSNPTSSHPSWANPFEQTCCKNNATQGLDMPILHPVWLFCDERGCILCRVELGQNSERSVIVIVFAFAYEGMPALFWSVSAPLFSSPFPLDAEAGFLCIFFSSSRVAMLLP